MSTGRFVWGDRGMKPVEMETSSSTDAPSVVSKYRSIRKMQKMVTIGDA